MLLPLALAVVIGAFLLAKVPTARGSASTPSAESPLRTRTENSAG
jgi:hypothetical protein